MPFPYSLVSLAYGPLWFLAALFWFWMLYDCFRNEPERDLWIWLVIILNVPGAVLYFLARYLPRLLGSPPPFLGRWLRRRELWRAEAAVRNIGNPHQFVELGDILRETGRLERAADAYQQALERDPADVRALWAAASVETRLKRLDRAKAHLDALLKIDLDYKFGGASLAYGETLLGLGELDAARAHIERHLRRREDLEARILLAQVLGARGETEKARGLLEPLIQDLKPARDLRSRRARRSARKLLKTLRN